MYYTRDQDKVIQGGQEHSTRLAISYRSFDASCDFLSIAPELAWVVDLAKARGPQYCVKAPQPRPHSGKYQTHCEASCTKGACCQSVSEKVKTLLPLLHPPPGPPLPSNQKFVSEKVKTLVPPSPAPLPITPLCFEYKTFFPSQYLKSHRIPTPLNPTKFT